MSLCNVLKSYASPQAERNASVHSHSSSSLKMLLSTVRHSGCWHVSHMFNTPVACVFQSECVMASARFILIVRPGGKRGSLVASHWHRDTGGRLASQSPRGCLFLTYPHAHPYSILSPIHFLPASSVISVLPVCVRKWDRFHPHVVDYCLL